MRRIAPNSFAIPFSLAGLGGLWRTAADAGAAPRAVGELLFLAAAVVWLALVLAYGAHAATRRGTLGSDLMREERPGRGHPDSLASGAAAGIGRMSILRPHGRMTDAAIVVRRDARAMAEKLTIVDVEGGVPAAVARIEDALDRLGVEVFARIDHAAGARAAGLELPDEVVLVFGDPAVGTALMQADPRVGIDLPLRMLVWAEDGRTRVGYRDPRGLAVDPASAEVATVLGRMNGLLERLAREAAGGG